MRSTRELLTYDFVELEMESHNIQMLLDDGNRITIPQGNFKLFSIAPNKPPSLSEIIITDFN